MGVRVYGSTVPGGSNTQVQYNNSGAFGGITNVTTNGTNLTAITSTGGGTFSGGTISLNVSSNFAVNIATGTSTGNVTIGSTGSGANMSFYVATGNTVVIGTSGATLAQFGSGGNSLAGATCNINVSSNFAANINTGTTTGAVTIGNSSAGAVNITSNAASTFAFTGGAFILQTTSQNLTVQTVTSGTLAITSAGALNLNVPANTATTLQVRDSNTVNYCIVDTRTGVTGVRVHQFTAATVSFASAAGNTFGMVQIPAYTLTQSGTTTITALNGLSLLVDAPTVNDVSSITITTASAVELNGPLRGGAGVTFTNTITLDLPTYAAAGTTASCVRAAAPTGATNNFAFFASSGASGFAGAVGVGFSTVPSGSGVNVGAASTNNSIWSASQGAATTTLYIGNASINVTSDVRLKRDIVPTRLSATELFRQVTIKDFTWNDPSDKAPGNRNSRGRWTGFIAQDVIDVFPWAINAEDRTCVTCRGGLPCSKHTSYWHTEWSSLVPLVIKGQQELDKRILVLETELALLRNQQMA